MAYRAIVFDLFNTLTSIKETKPEGGTTHDLVGADKDEWNRTFYKHPDERYIRNDLDLVGRLQEYAERLGINLSRERAEEIERIRTHRFQHALKQVAADVVQDLKVLRDSGLRLGILSDADSHECSGWDDSPLKPVVHAARFSCLTGHQKPDPIFYKLILGDLDVSAEETLFVGDGGSNELLGAMWIGMTPVLITRHLRLNGDSQIIDSRRIYADRVIESIPELFPLVGITP